MLTDWVLIRRLAGELEQRVRGARAQDAGLLADGRVALALRTRGRSVLLAIDAFASPPVVTLEEAEFAIAVEPGFVRVMAASLRGMTLAAARVRRGDRLLRLEFASRSRFGVGEKLDLYVELVPRFGNVLLVKGDTVIAALKEFSPSENASRAVAAGMPYALPPLPAGAGGMPKLVAESGADEAAFLAFALSDDALREPLYVYRRAGALVQAHLVALAQFTQCDRSRESSLLDVFDELRVQQAGKTGHERIERRRRAGTKRLDARERKLRDELVSLHANRQRAQQRGDLRVQGEEILASLHALPPAEQGEAKECAAGIFARYKKLGAALPHVVRREGTVRAALEAVDALRWEFQRAAPEDLGDVEAALAQLEPRANARPKAAPNRKRKRAPLEFRTPEGSRIVVGRSPAENADLTFRLARPNDLWFHAQGIPGAHVILARDDRREPSAADIEAAAALAAFHSKSKASVCVPVDYTQRKHVRKQPHAPPGLVWYTKPKTLLVAPKENVEGTSDLFAP